MVNPNDVIGRILGSTKKDKYSKNFTKEQINKLKNSKFMKEHPQFRYAWQPCSEQYKEQKMKDAAKRYNDWKYGLGEEKSLAPPKMTDRVMIRTGGRFRPMVSVTRAQAIQIQKDSVTKHFTKHLKDDPEMLAQALQEIERDEMSNGETQDSKDWWAHHDKKAHEYQEDERQKLRERRLFGW